MGATVAEVRAALDAAYPPELAADWDTGIGLTCGDPDSAVTAVLLAVDIDAAVVTQALDIGAQLIVTHHPLLFRPVQSVATDTAKGALLHRIIRAGLAHMAVHTNADHAEPGVNTALAEAVGLGRLRPLRPDPPAPTDKIVTYVPVQDAAAMIAALSAAGAGHIGDYDQAAFSAEGTGQFRPLPGATPAIGAVGRLEQVPESRIEMIAPRSRRAEVIAALRAAHRYSEPAFDILERGDAGPGRTGSGRLGDLPAPVTLAEFAAGVAAVLPATVTGVRVAGDPGRMVRRVAVCGGAGDGELDAATAAGADAYLTSDLRHHVAAEHTADPRRPALIEVAHFAGEWPWLGQASGVIESATAGSVSTTVSTLRTDPWTARYPSASH